MSVDPGTPLSTGGANFATADNAKYVLAFTLTETQFARLTAAAIAGETTRFQYARQALIEKLTEAGF